MKKQKVGKILLYVSFGIMLAAICCVLFTSLGNIKASGTDPITGDSIKIKGPILTLFIALVFGAKARITLSPTGGEVLNTEVTAKLGAAYIYFVAMLLLIGVMVASVVLIIKNKYHGKLKLILSIAFWVLAATVFACAVLTPDLVEYNYKELPAEFIEKYGISNLGATGSPTSTELVIIIGLVGVIVNIVGSVLNKDQKTQPQPVAQEKQK